MPVSQREIVGGPQHRRSEKGIVHDDGHNNGDGDSATKRKVGTTTFCGVNLLFYPTDITSDGNLRRTEDLFHQVTGRRAWTRSEGGCEMSSIGGPIRHPLQGTQFADVYSAQRE